MLSQAQYIFIYEVLAANLMTSLPVPIKDFNLSYLLQERDGKRLIEEEFQVSLEHPPPTFAEMSVCRRNNNNQDGDILWFNFKTFNLASIVQRLMF